MKEPETRTPPSAATTQYGMEEAGKSDTHSTPSSPTASSTSHDSIHSIDDHDLSSRPNLSRATSTHDRIPADMFPHPDLVQPYRPKTNRTTTSILTSGSRPPDFEIDFDEDDPENPRNWPLWYRSCVIGIISFSTWAVVLYSTSYTSAMPGMMHEFGITNEPLTTMGITFYLLGLAVGSMVLAPASEIYGRRPVYCVALLLFTITVIPCALATSLAQVLGLRFLSALCGAAMIANAPGSVSDIVDEEHRALAFSIWSIGPMNGPITGPLIGGFVYQYLGWRWTNWIVVIVGGVAWISTSLIKETYTPTILKKRAEKRRKETGDDRWWCRYDEKISVREAMKTNLSRPFVMTATEPILWFWDLYIAVIYGILYLCFVAYPLIFSGIRGWSPGITGLSFAGVGIGTMMAIVFEPLIRRMIEMHPVDPATGKRAPESAVSIVCIAALLCPIGQLWFSWTSVPASIHWIWSLLAGIPFGAGNTLVFIYATNYLSGSYGVYTASALAGNSVVRSLLGGTLPLAGPSMYTTLSPQWAGTLMGGLQVLLIPIPFVFYRYGGKIRERSPLIRRMREEEERMEERARRGSRRVERGELRRGRSGTSVAAQEKGPIEGLNAVNSKSEA